MSNMKKVMKNYEDLKAEWTEIDKAKNYFQKIQ